MKQQPLAAAQPTPRFANFEVTKHWGEVNLLDLLPAGETHYAWLGEEVQMVGWGEAARLSVSGPERFSRAQRWWSNLSSEILASSKSHLAQAPTETPPLVAFVSFGFSDQAESLLVVPEVLVIRRNEMTRVILVDAGVAKLSTHEQREAHLKQAASAALARRGSANTAVTWAGSADLRSEWSSVVSATVSRIAQGELDKVVIARSAEGLADSDIDTVKCLDSLAKRYPNCWTFQVEDLLGATPELLVAKKGDFVHSKVLAGTIHSQSLDVGSTNLNSSAKLAELLLESAKDLAEHEYAVRSVSNALAHHCDDLSVPKRPDVLSLGGISHLATEVTGQLADGAPVLALAASLHPTAAVCGTPTERAMAVIAEVETIDRERYAGPVGWVDSNQDGELAIALRCARMRQDRVIAYAGCGLVAGSLPDQEWQESEAKLSAIKGLFVDNGLANTSS